ncbi:MAG: glycoside hydrolase family 15 protein, partial [Actinobacteria bacterium]
MAQTKTSDRTRAAKPALTYPPIATYGLIGDGHTAALVSTTGSIDWCCLPRFDSGSCFGRILDWRKGGYCSITPTARSYSSSRRYVDGTLVLETTFRARGGEARVLDCFTMRKGGAESPYRQILRVVQGVRGEMELDAVICPRFDYCEVRPWIRKHGERFFSLIGGDDG